ncbi:MAG: S41 family peptidase [Prevotellaceae bacterium]|nr:S41 family peptidase [Prevotellaceae bacterium]MDY3364940.1 S41 family peptidase [Prevotella sp.]
MKKILTALALAGSMASSAQTNPLWMRHCAISPDGKTIAFSYKGDIFTVPVDGGNAQQLTSNAAYDAYPVWSKDGNTLAFASAREGSLDVYSISRWGGEPQRLTTQSGDEIPLTYKDNKTVLYQAVGMPTAQSILFASHTFPQIYEVGIEGGRSKLFSTLPMIDLDLRANGDALYHDQKGYEDPFRKHHQSPITRDIWLKKGHQYTKLTSFNGEDRTPRWAANGDAYYYLSEEDGTFNVYKRQLDGSGKTQLTHHKNHPVRFLTVAGNGTLCYGYDGEIYTLKEGASPQKVNVQVTADRNDKDLNRKTLTNGAREVKLSPNGKEVAFVLNGDVYVTSLEYNTTKQITNTPQQERNVNFSPDGRAIVYAAERNGLWQIYQTRLKKSTEKMFTYATELEEEQLVNSGKTSLQPAYSPDGKSIAFFENRSTLRVMDVKSKAVRTVMDGKFVYSYADGDLYFEWSPDSRWLLTNYIGHGGWNSPDVALVNADGKGEIHNLTESGYADGGGKWVLGGKAMLFFSDRAGYRSHGSWGAERDVYIMFFDLDAYENFRMTKEERSLAKEEKAIEKAAEQPAQKGKDKKKKAEKKPEPKVLTFDLDNCRDRIVRLTVNSSHLGDAILSPGGDTLYYQAAFEGGADLWKRDLKENKTEIVMKNVGAGELEADKAFKNLFLCTWGAIKQIDLSKGSSKNVNFEARFNHQPYAERQYIFDHAWQQVKDKFYEPTLHGTDWEGYRKSYQRFLPHINNNYDFRDMLSELLGELNASHTGARYNAPGAPMASAELGIFIDHQYQGDGIKVEEVVKRGPFDVKKTGVGKGSIIEKIDGEPILQGKDYTHLLDGKVNKNVRLTVYNPKEKKRFDVTVKAISKGMLQDLLYKRWVDRNRQLVDSLSGGRLAYVHVRAMNSESFRTVYSELLSDKNRRREAVIVDERHNGGGWLHDDLCTLLSGKEYQQFVPNGRYVGSDPFNKWTKPSCVLICEDDYSNGHGFPMVYKELGIGKLIGTPVAGTMTAVWWEAQIDPSIIFGIPQVGCRDMRGNYGENKQLNPDIEVYNSPEDYINGRDRQLERAVQEMLKVVKQK